MSGVIIEKKIRVQVLSKDIVRIEYNKKGVFEDKNTFFVPNRSNFDFKGLNFEDDENCYRLTVSDMEIIIKKHFKSLSSLSVYKKGKIVYQFKRIKNTGELPKVNETPEIFALSDEPRLVLPEKGYSKDTAVELGSYALQSHVQDVYLLNACKDHRKLRQLYVSLTGRTDMVSLSKLGVWNSKFYAYNEESVKKTIQDYKDHNIPLDNFVIDTDWRSDASGIGYEVNTELFPDISSVFNYCHERGISVIMNDHPEPEPNSSTCLDTMEMGYRCDNLGHFLSMGLDSWWYDRNWSTKLISPDKHIASETLGMYIYNEITKHYHESLVSEGQSMKRNDILANVSNIENGKYISIVDSASHRYPLQWTGDIGSSEIDLAREVKNLIYCSDNCLPYVSSDIGGHNGVPNKDLYLRWIEFGCFSPIFRPHCTKDLPFYREPWNYDEETVDVFREYVNMRYHLMPYIYARAYNSYLTGESIFTSLSFQYPGDLKAEKADDTYMLGRDILISPIGKIDYKEIKARDYKSSVSVDFYNGKELKGDVIHHMEMKTISLDLSGNQIHKNVPVNNFSARFTTTINFKSNYLLLPYSDDGIRIYIDDVLLFEDFTEHSAYIAQAGVVKKGVHKVTVEYFQAEGEANLKLYYIRYVNKGKRKIYLPKGQWLDAFSGKVYNGEGNVVKYFDPKELPIFIRLGSLLPLAYSSENLKNHNWKDMVYDYYPSFTESDEFYVYEDDNETEAYKKGEFRKTPYSAHFDKEQNSFIIKIGKAVGEYEAESQYRKRNAIFRYHLMKGFRDVDAVYVNGKKVKTNLYHCRISAMPFASERKNYPDSATISYAFTQDLHNEYVIEVRMKKSK